jgi:hypothetical protein
MPTPIDNTKRLAQARRATGRRGHRSVPAHLAPALLSGLAVAVAASVPGWLHGAAALDAWSLLTLLAASASALTPAAARCERAALFGCVAATSVGMTLDFLRIDPQALAALCGGGGGWGLAAMGAHLRWFPASALGMLLALAMLRPAGASAWLLLPGFGLMLAMMTLAMHALRLLAWELAWSWGAHSMACAMMLGMFAWLLALRLGARLWRRLRRTAARHLPPRPDRRA